MFRRMGARWAPARRSDQSQELASDAETRDWISGRNLMRMTGGVDPDHAAGMERERYIKAGFASGGAVGAEPSS